MTDDLATDIVRRANKVGISISKLCKEAGVSRRWFEYLKKRTPRAVEAYINMDDVLSRLEKEQEDENRDSRGKTGRD